VYQDLLCKGKAHENNIKNKPKQIQIEKQNKWKTKTKQGAY
jgi:hypothetical protein